MSISNNTVGEPTASCFLDDDTFYEVVKKANDSTLRKCRLVSKNVGKIAELFLQRHTVNDLSSIQNQLRVKFPNIEESRITWPSDVSYSLGANDLAKNLLNKMCEDKEFKTFFNKQLSDVELLSPQKALERITQNLSSQGVFRKKSLTFFCHGVPRRKEAFEFKPSPLRLQQ